MDASVRGLSAQEIVKIVKACSEAGVKEFRFGDLEFTLGPRDNEASQVVGVPESLLKNYVATADEANAEQEEVSSEIEAMIHERQLEDMLIEDPLAHEELAQKVLDGEEPE